MQKKTGFQQKGLLLHHLIQDRPIKGQFVNHSHNNEYEICLVIKGKGVFKVEGHEYPIKDRSVFLFQPNEKHVAQIDFPHIFERYTFFFSESALTTANIPMSLLLSAFNRRPFGKYNVYYDSELNFDFINSCFQRMMTPDFSTFSLSVKVHIFPVLYELRQAYLHLGLEYEDNDKHSKLYTEIRHYIKLHYTEDISLKSLANIFFTSKSTIHRMFKTYSDDTFYNYLTRVRMLNAQKLVKTTNLNFTDIAEMCGFCEYSSFYRMYKNFFLISPSADRKEKSQLLPS